MKENVAVFPFIFLVVCCLVSCTFYAKKKCVLSGYEIVEKSHFMINSDNVNPPFIITVFLTLKNCLLFIFGVRIPSL